MARAAKVDNYKVVPHLKKYLKNTRNPTSTAPASGFRGNIFVFWLWYADAQAPGNLIVSNEQVYRLDK